jgi:hypothetical protein
MANYTQTTNFTALTVANAVINGAAFDLEYGNVSTAIASKFDNLGAGYPGPFVMTAVAAHTTLKIAGAANQDALLVTGNATAGQSFGVGILAGTNSSDQGLFVANQTGATTLFRVYGDGGVVVGSPTGLSKGVGTVNATAYYLNGNTITASGTFTGTITGCTTAPTATFNYEIAGNTATIYCSAGLTGTSNATTCTITGMPSLLNPVNGQLATLQLEDNTAAFIGLASPSGGVITLQKLANASFTGSGTKGWFPASTITYSLV